MATLTNGIVLATTEQITNIKLQNLVALGTCTNIVNSDISNSAAIAYSKLNLTGAILNADLAGGITYAKLSLSANDIPASKVDLTSPGAIGTTAPAAGKFTTLEATTTLKLGTTHQGDVLYDNGTSLVRLTPGTSGQFLKTQGASANPVWATQSNTFSFVSNTPITTATTTGAIALTTGNNYFVEFEFRNLSNTDILVLTFNSDSGSHYKHINTYQTTSSTTAVISNNSASSTSINIGYTIASASTSGIMGSFYIQQIGTSQIYRVWGQFVQDGSSLFTAGSFYGSWTNSANITDFELATSSARTMDGSVNLYQIKTS